MFLCRCRWSEVGGMGFLKLISQAFPRPLPQSPLAFFLLVCSLSFSLALHYLNAWNRLPKCQRDWQNVFVVTGSPYTRFFSIHLSITGLKNRVRNTGASLKRGSFCWGFTKFDHVHRYKNISCVPRLNELKANFIFSQ